MLETETVFYVWPTGPEFTGEGDACAPYIDELNMLWKSRATMGLAQVREAWAKTLERIENEPENLATRVLEITGFWVVPSTIWPAIGALYDMPILCNRDMLHCNRVAQKIACLSATRACGQVPSLDHAITARLKVLTPTVRRLRRSR